MKMGIYTKVQKREKKRPGMNPIWRGIGCILLVILPLIGYGLTVLLIPILLETGYVPFELQGRVNFPLWFYRLPVLSGMANFIRGINNLYLGIIVFIVVLVLLTGISSLIYVAILQIIGPPRYSELDAPPSKHKVKVYKR
jgi:uncharacterized membrane protein